MFTESYGFVTVSVVNSDNFVSLHKFKHTGIKLEPVCLILLVIGIATKPRLSGNMIPNIEKCENGWSNLTENLRVVAIKWLEVTRFAS